MYLYSSLTRENTQTRKLRRFLPTPVGPLFSGAKLFLLVRLAYDSNKTVDFPLFNPLQSYPPFTDWINCRHIHPRYGRYYRVVKFPQLDSAKSTANSNLFSIGGFVYGVFFPTSLWGAEFNLIFRVKCCSRDTPERRMRRLSDTKKLNKRGKNRKCAERCWVTSNWKWITRGSCRLL